MKTKNHFTSLCRIAALLAIVAVCGINESKATTKTAVLTGFWGTDNIWSPYGVPTASDDAVIITGVTVTLSSNQSINKVTVNTGGTLTWNTNANILTMTGNLSVSGTVDMNNGNITQNTVGALFTITNSGSFTWNPGNSTVGGATLFTNSTESFSMYSTLKIEDWYDYTNVPLGSVVTGNFGNLSMSSKGSGSNVYEWNQNNQFQTHLILGTLTIDRGWITLDKSGSISNTTIGSISILDNTSIFYAHRGTHPGSFTLNTNSISVSAGGTFVGLLNGNGNITLNVDGNITTHGNFGLIKNDGVLSVGNGNATLSVTGTFYQLDGDTRIIYNISTTNSGVFNVSIGNIEFDGGIFMGQYACHNASQICSLVVANNINAIFASGSEKFRGLGLTSLSGNNNNAKLYFYVGGNLIITSSSNGAEFSTSASTGTEENIINGTFQTSGGQTNIDYGTGQASHNSTLTVNGNMNALSGTLNLSRLDGTTTIIVEGNVAVSNGATLSVKGGNGTANMTINGNFVQTGGTFNLHANTSVIATSPVTVTVNGDFTQSGGTINFDANGSGLSAIDHFIINGANFTLNGTSASMTQAGAGSNMVFGYLEFTRKGTTKYNRNNANHVLTQIKIIVADGTTLDVYTGSIQIASHSIAGTDFLTVQEGGTLMLRGYQVYSNGTYTYSGMRVESGGTVSTMNLFGLYDGTNFAAIKAANNTNFYLDANSTVEYNGWSNQIITGTGPGVATTNNHKYGKLQINFSGTQNVNYLYPTSSNVFVRTQLVLYKGELFLNGKVLTIENGNTDAITRTAGYIKSESASASDSSYVRWKALTNGAHIFPFGKNSTTYLPVTFSPSASAGGDVLISTRATPQNNLPYPVSPINLQAAISPVDPSLNWDTDYALDRWWNIEAPGYTASFILTYAGIENTILSNLRTGLLDLQECHNGSWATHSGLATGTVSTTGTIGMYSTSTFSAWHISAPRGGPLPLTLLSFSAQPATNAVMLSWTTAIEINNDFFTLEKSKDGIHFTSFAKVDGAGNSNERKTYSYMDKNISEGITYYRLTQTDFDGTTVRLKVVSVNIGDVAMASTLSIESVFPSPFNERFTALISCAQEETVQVNLSDMNGKVVHSDSFTSEKGTNSYQYENNVDLPKGIYFLKITGAGKTITKKIVKN